MSNLLDIQAKMQDTSVEIARLRYALAEDPADWGLGAMLESLERRQEQLEEAFLREADLKQTDLCRYRAIREDKQFYPISAVGETLKAFQGWFSTVLDAKRNGPKIRGKISPEIVEQSEMGFAYSFAGSLGFMFTIPNERLLIGDSDIDSAMGAMSEMAKANEPDLLKAIAKKYGIASIRRMFSWASNNAQYSVGVDIKWVRRGDVLNELRMQPADAQYLCDIITATSDEKVEEIQVTGTLIGADTKTRRFHMSFKDAEEILGSFSKTFTHEVKMTLGQPYRARIRKGTIVHYATEQEDVTFELIDLRSTT